MITARGYKKVLEVQSFLHEAYKEPLTGDYLEEKFDINFDYLNRLFRKNMKKTVFQYLRDIRIAHAKQLLTTTSMRIMEVSVLALLMKAISVKFLRSRQAFHLQIMPKHRK